MITLGIETSCDETSIALLETGGISADTWTNIDENPISYRVLGHTTFSQIDIHAEYGGVFPVLAKREHGRRIVPLLLQVIEKSNFEMVPFDSTTKAERIRLVTEILSAKEPELLKAFLESSLISHKPCKHTSAAAGIDQIAVTHGPGLEPALWVGVNFARALGAIWNIPVIPTNHMEGHIVGSLLPSDEISEANELSKKSHLLIPIKFPAIALLISGGHTELIHVKSIGDYTVLGRTRDDAIGEAFDKVAHMMNIPYPGGPKIAELAGKARENFAKNLGQKNPKNPIVLPRPMLHSPDLDFSFSGLKTSVLYLLQKMKAEQSDANTDLISGDDISNIALAFEDAVTDVLVAKTSKALDEHESHALIVGGGVIANGHIRSSLTKLAESRDIPILLPPPLISGDNALMIALAGALHSSKEKRKQTGSPAFSATISAQGNLSL